MQSTSEMPQIWRRVSKHVLSPHHPFALHKVLFEATYVGWDAGKRSYQAHSKAAAAVFHTLQRSRVKRMACYKHTLQILRAPRLPGCPMSMEWPTPTPHSS